MKAKMTSNAFRSNAIVPAFSNFPDMVRKTWPTKLQAPTMTIRKRSLPEAGRHVWPKMSATVIASEKPMKPNQETVTDQWISRENIKRNLYSTTGLWLKHFENVEKKFYGKWHPRQQLGFFLVVGGSKMKNDDSSGWNFIHVPKWFYDQAGLYYFHIFTYVCHMLDICTIFCNWPRIF